MALKEWRLLVLAHALLTALADTPVDVSISVQVEGGRVDKVNVPRSVEAFDVAVNYCRDNARHDMTTAGGYACARAVRGAIDDERARAAPRIDVAALARDAPLRAALAHAEIERFAMYAALAAPLRAIAARRAAPLDVLDVSGSPFMLEMLGARARPNVTGVNYPAHDVQALPRAWAGAFDVVLLDQVLEHLPRPWDAAREVRRVLRRGGAAVLTTCFLAPWHASPSDYFRFSPEGLRSLVEAHGFGAVGAAGGWGDRELLGALIRDGYSLDAHDRRLAELGWSALGADALEKARWLNARPDNRGNDHATWVVAYA